ncbi:MAG: hypothetical protein AB2826_21455 [Candidatus Thiodiazotropha sp.]
MSNLSNIKHHADLIFLLSADRKQVAVHVVTVEASAEPGEQPIYSQEETHWTIDARAFGPDATLQLSSDRQPPSWDSLTSGSAADLEYYRVGIGNVRFGKNGNRKLTYVFSLNKSKSDGAYQWILHADTDFWSDSLQFGDANGKGVLLSDFIKGDIRLEANIASKSDKKELGDTLGLIFNGLLAKSGYQVNRQGDYGANAVIRITKDAEWAIAPLNDEEIRPLFVALHRQVNFQKIRIARCFAGGAGAKAGINSDICGEGKNDPPVQQATVVGVADVDLPNEGLGFFNGDVGVNLMPSATEVNAPRQADSVARRYSIHFKTEDAPPGQDLVGVSSTGGGDPFPTRSTARIDAVWDLEIRGKESTGPFKSIGGEIVAASVSLPVSEESKKDISIAFHGDFSSEDENRISSPIGRTRVFGLDISQTGAKASGHGGDADKSVSFAVKPVWKNLAAKEGSLAWLFRDYWLQRAEVSCLLVESSVAPRGVDFSHLVFDRSAIRFVYSDQSPAENFPGSVVFLNEQTRGHQLAFLNLNRARLQVGRAGDLVALGFRFQNLYLSVRDNAVEVVASNSRIGHWAEPRVLSGDDGQATRIPDEELKEVRGRASRGMDTRPTLVVEFPPQHVLEEVFFKPGPAPLPDNAGKPKDGQMPYVERVALGDKLKIERTYQKPGTASVTGSADGTFLVDPNDIDAVVSALGMLDALPDDRNEFRECLRKIKSAVPEGIDECKESPTASEAEFREFREFACAFAASGLHEKIRNKGDRVSPADQRIYVGPYAMDPDVFAIARQVANDIRESTVTDWMLRLFKEAFGQAQDWNRRENEENPPSTREQRLRREAALERAIPNYQLFRDWHRNQPYDSSLDYGECVIQPRIMEYCLPDTALERHQLEAGVYEKFRGWLIASENIEGLAEARNSRPTRLSFAINCRDKAAVAGTDDLGGMSVNARELTGNKVFKFDFAALSNWSDMTLRVVRRAERVVLPAPDGRMDANAPNRAIDVAPGAMLDHLGFSDGPFTSANIRLAEVFQSLRDRPDALQTEIVVPARVSLSTHADAVFLTPQPVPPELYKQEGTGQTIPSRRSPNRQPLWSARLVCDGLDPGLRVIHSPDLRADFVFTGVQKRDGSHMQVEVEEDGVKKLKQLARLPGGSPPPGTDLAPWFIGLGESVAEHPTILELRDALKSRLSGVGDSFFEATDERAFCKLLLADGNEEQRKLFPQLIVDMCRHTMARPDSSVPDDQFDSNDHDRLRKLRTGLSARDRAELVLLGSAWGLPVMGRRNLQGGLTADSSQEEPEERHRLSDVMPGSALYQPGVLRVEELRLSALGASFRHNSSFQPPASARHISDRELFDALSIEQWQHWTVLGRDILTEVVYKGFLIPTTNRASMVKVTERTFIRDNRTKLIRAYLRQRIFIRCSKPEKRFPALGQPNGGRRFPCARIEILTTQTPDIVDPYETGPLIDGIAPGGRIQPGNSTGLMFWPRTAKISGAEVRFELSVDRVNSDLPLIFVDNTAANDADTMAALRAYYNSLATPESDSTGNLVPPKHMRTVALKGEKLRYAPEIKSGSASLETDYWTLALEGGEKQEPVRSAVNKEGVTFFSLRNNDFVFNSILQGADQPPIYPFVERCRVRLRQNERLTGNVEKPVLARINGHFAVVGFRPRNGESEKQSVEPIWEGNTQECFLDLIKQPELKMGPRGDQSGGVFRPSGFYVSISRNKGLLTYRKKLPDPGGAPNRESERIPSFGTLYSSNVGVEGEPRVSGLAAGSASMQATADDIKKVYKRFFSQDAKLFGLVKITDIIAYVGGRLDDPETGAPELIERVRYGAQQANGAALESIETVRDTVVRPLSAAVKRVRSDWRALDRELASKQKLVDQTDGIIKAISLTELFPELDSGLSALDDAIDQALAETDPILSGLALSEVYEAGRRFLDAVVATSSNPLGRISSAVEQRFKGLEEFVGKLLGEWSNLSIRLFESFNLPSDPDELNQKLIEWVVDHVFPQPPEDAWYYLPLPYPDFAILGVDAVRVRQSLAIRVKDVKALFTRILQDLASQDKLNQPLLDGDKPEWKIGEEQIKQLLESAIARVEKAVEMVESLSSAQKDEALRRLYIYKGLLEFESKYVLKYVRDAISDELAIANELWTRAKGFVGNLEKGELAEAAGEAIEFIELFVGDIDLVPGDLCGEISLGRVVATAANATVDLSGFGACNPVMENSGTVLKRCPVGNSAPLPKEFAPGGAGGLCGGLYRTQEKLFALLGKISEEEMQKITDALKPAEAKEVIAELLQGLRPARTAMGKLAGLSADTFADLYNDSIDVFVLQQALQVAIKNVPTDFCNESKLEESVRALAELPKALASFTKGRALLLKRVAEGIDDVVQEFGRLFSDPMFQKFLAAASLGGVLAALWKEGAGDADAVKQGKKLVEEIKSSATSYVQELAKVLSGTAKEFDELARSLKQRMTDLLNQIEKFDKENKFIKIDIQGVREQLEAIKETLCVIGPVAQQLEGLAAVQDLTPEQLKDFTIDVRDSDCTTSFKGLEFFKVNASVSFNTAVLTKFENDVKSAVEKVSDSGKKYLRNMQSEVLNELDEIIKNILKGPAIEVGEQYRKLIDLRDSEEKSLRAGLCKWGDQGGKFIAKLDVLRRGENFGHPPGGETLNNAEACSFDLSKRYHDRLMRDAKFLTNTDDGWFLDKPVSVFGHRRFLRTFLQEWKLGKGDPPAPLMFARQIGDLAMELLRGKIFQLIPLEQIRDAIEEELLNLVPVKTDLSYGFGMTLDKKVGEATGGIFVPADGCPLRMDFSAELDLVAGKPRLELVSTGSLGPFDIALIGKYYHAVTLHFGGASFVSRNGQKPNWNLVYDDFEIGPVLDFLQHLQTFLSPKDGSGFYLTLTRGYPGIEAGYALAIGTINIGNMAIFNVSLNASAIIPFDGKPALFKCSLSRRDRPFTIALMPYGGSGFFALIADSKGIIGFEASFEYGAAVAFNFGPLSGQGRVMAGIYVRQLTLPSGKIAEILGTFYAGGSASLWIFSLSTSLSVRLGQQNGDMVGNATYTFAFSLALKDFEFSVGVEKREEKPGKSKAASLAFAQGRGALNAKLRSDLMSLTGGATIRAKIKQPREDWNAYRQYFNQDADVEDFFQ